MRSSYATYISPNYKYDTETAGVWCQPELNGSHPPSLLQKHFDFTNIERMRSIYTPGVQASTCYTSYSAQQAIHVPYGDYGSYLTPTEKHRQKVMLSNPLTGTKRRN